MMTRKIRKGEGTPAKAGAVELEEKDLDEVQGGISLVTPIVQGVCSGETKNPSNSIQVALGDGSVR